MVKVSEKRSISIPPTRIDKELFVNVGNMLRAECPKGHEVSIQVYSDSRNIVTEKPEEFEDIEIPSDTYRIEMNIRHPTLLDKTPIQIEMDLRRPENSKTRVMGENATWVHGVTDRLSEAFEKKKLGYHYVARYKHLRSILSFMSSLLLAYAIASILGFFKLESGTIVVVGMLAFLVMVGLTERFYDWVFPYFEIGNKDFLPPKVRKWALTIIWSSGILPTILLKMLEMT